VIKEDHRQHPRIAQTTIQAAGTTGRLDIRASAQKAAPTRKQKEPVRQGATLPPPASVTGRQGKRPPKAFFFFFYFFFFFVSRSGGESEGVGYQAPAPFVYGIAPAPASRA